jgi:hypothetical protein
MRYVIVASLVGLGLGLILFGIGATSGDRSPSFDPHRPATLLPVAEHRVREFGSAVIELVRDLVDEFTAPYRERIRRDGLTPVLPQ